MTIFFERTFRTDNQQEYSSPIHCWMSELSNIIPFREKIGKGPYFDAPSHIVLNNLTNRHVITLASMQI